jgi:hypothetical protein
MNENAELSAKRAAKNAYMREYARRVPKYRLYDVWRLMVRRCEDSRHKNYECYGARGITLCGEWHDFSVFWDWAQETGYKPGLQLNRIDNDGPYSPKNCEWTTSRNNNRNRSNNKLSVEKVAEIRHRLTEGRRNGAALAREFGVHHSLIYRIKLNQQWL